MEPVQALGPPSWLRHPIRRFKSRIRMFQWGKYERVTNFDFVSIDYRHFIRLYPNPGFTLGSLHYCHAQGWGEHKRKGA